MENTKERVIGILVAIIVAVCAIVLAGCSGGSSSNSQPEQQKSNEPSPLEIVDSGYTIQPLPDGKCKILYGVMVENPNDGWFANDVWIDVTARNADGNVADTDLQGTACIFCDGKVAICGATTIEKAESLEFSIDEMRVNWEEGTLTQEEVDSVLYTKGLTESRDAYGTFKLSGEIVNDTDNALSIPTVNVLMRDSSDKIIGGFRGYVDNVAPQKTTAFTVHEYDVPKYASLEAYIDLGNVTN